MVSIFKKYGEVCYFDSTFKLIREKTPDQNLYPLGCFVGQSSDLFIVPFGFTITEKETKDVYKVVFVKFFQMMGKSPTVIITDQHRSIISALQELK